MKYHLLISLIILCNASSSFANNARHRISAKTKVTNITIEILKLLNKDSVGQIIELSIKGNSKGFKKNFFGIDPYELVLLPVADKMVFKEKLSSVVYDQNKNSVGHYDILDTQKGLVVKINYYQHLKKKSREIIIGAVQNNEILLSEDSPFACHYTQTINKSWITGRWTEDGQGINCVVTVKS